MSSYRIKLVLSDAVRKYLYEEKLNLVVGKAVGTVERPTYRTAWHVLTPSELAQTVELSWTVNYTGSFTTEKIYDRFSKYTTQGNDIQMVAGHIYDVTASGTMIENPNKPPRPNSSSFFFCNGMGYGRVFRPVLKTPAPGASASSPGAPFWLGDHVQRNGAVIATPVEKVIVWFGKYNVGAAILEEVMTVAVEFDLTEITSGSAEIADDLSAWKNLSPNAQEVDVVPVE
ncbi:hypothetical protein VaNZ11_001445 [Volvox africanus]|uniref:Uncharacterized protein n=1 Tax=Volvox africanus TaxID=51714 RepID=A0ABQ5RPU6_9CHLO|nr:hypothetical protein VaNZ11_001441 [Volvox africanus]GLI59547.1 hypothetical protein VaNZ11_001445 [Volvox africanus]